MKEKICFTILFFFFQVSKTTRELILEWNKRSPVDLSSDLKMPQFTVAEVSVDNCAQDQTSMIGKKRRALFFNQGPHNGLKLTGSNQVLWKLTGPMEPLETALTGVLWLDFPLERLENSSEINYGRLFYSIKIWKFCLQH